MKIVLVIPPSPFLIDDRVFPFLGPLQIAATARAHGHDVVVSDLTGHKRRHRNTTGVTFDDVFQEASIKLVDDARDADIVGFYSLAAQHPGVTRLRRALVDAYPAVRTVLGGPHASTSPERCISDGFDYVVVSDQGGGGGEAGLLELLDRLRGTKKKKSLIESDRVIRIPSRRGVTWENDEWPLPARDLIDIRDYLYKIDDIPATSIVTATGCPFACTYCSHWQGYRKLEAKSSNYVREEIREVRDKYGFDAVMFYDDEINLRPDFVTDFLPMVKKERIVWRAFFKNGKNLTNSETFRLMAESGCVQLCTGAESANAKILKDIRKGATLSDNTAFVRLCVENGIKPKVFTQVGLPGETHDTVKELRDWLVSMAQVGLADADVSITTPYEGTPIYENPEKHDVKFDKEKLDYANDVVLYKGVPGEYKSYVWNDHMTREDIVNARQWVEDEFRSAAGLPSLIAKDDG